MPTSDRAQLSYKMTTEVSRSDFGYGNLPTSESTLDIDKKMSFNGLTMPRVDGLLADTVIHHPANLPLTFVDGHIDFDSGDVKFFPFGPKNGSATIIVRYRLEIVKNK